MKLPSSLLSLTLASVAAVCYLTPTAEAQSRHGDYDSHGSHGGSSGWSGGSNSHGGSSGSSGGHSSHGGNSGWSGSHHGPSYGHSSSHYQAPVRLLYTREIGRRTHYQLVRSRNGHTYSKRITTITYKATYSNGQTKIYTRTV